MSIPANQRAAAPKRRYTKPELTEFGSIRNLTGGSAGENGDFMSTFMAMP
ncbi:MAG: lasso RiPP family leader peptide-containing protein [Alteraurantiacibacter sp.]